jgi:DNA-binding SARP family transcriptional activator
MISDDGGRDVCTMNATICFRILGNVSVRDGGVEKRANGSKMWTVAAMLMAHANEVVGIEELVEEVWDLRAPVSAVANIRTYAHEVRRMLGMGAARLVSRRTGYQLHVDPAELDVTEFERLLAEGHTAADTDDTEQAVTWLSRALELFAGPALAGVRPGAALTRVATVLDEQRLSATEALFAAELARGRHRQLLPALRRHVEAHPLRESGWAHLMLGQYRSGDPAAALNAFAQARAILATELGIDPSPRLAGIQQAILHRSHELDLPVRQRTDTPTVTVTGRAPRELPRASPWLVGRVTELAAVRAALDGTSPGAAIVAVHGPGGTGKSALAIAAAHAQAHTFPGGQLYVDMRTSDGPLRAHAAAAYCLRSLEVTVPAQTSAVFARLRTALADRRVLLLLDNVEAAGQVEPLAPAHPGCALLVTSRRVLATLDATQVGLADWSLLDALALLRAVVGRGRIEADPVATATGSAYCDHLPLALRIAAARLVARPELTIGDLAECLADERTRLDRLACDGRSIHACFEPEHAALLASADPIDRLAVRLFADLGHAPAGPVLMLDVADRLHTSTRHAEAVLARLVDARLLTVTAPGRYRISVLARLFARQAGAVAAR